MRNRWLNLGALSVALLLYAVAECEDGFYYHGASYSKTLFLRLYNNQERLVSVGDTVTLDGQFFNISVPGLTVFGSNSYNVPFTGCAEETGTAKGLVAVLMHKFLGTTHAIRLKTLSPRGSLSVHKSSAPNNPPIECDLSPYTEGGTRSGYMQMVEFEVTRSATVFVFCYSVYAMNLSCTPRVHSQSAVGMTDINIYDVTVPANPELVYAKSFTHHYPGSIFTSDHTVDLLSGRRYRVTISSSSFEFAAANSYRRGLGFEEARAIINGGMSSGVTLLYDVNSGHSGSLVGDVNGDGCVDDADLLHVLACLGSSIVDLSPQEPVLNEFCLLADVNMDGVVDDLDLITVIYNFGLCL